jgi:P-type E1-E2 ATPase
LAIIIASVSILTGLFSFYQIFKSSVILNSYKRLSEGKYAVRRNNCIKDIYISAEDLVVGDVITIKAGDRIPADIRIIEANHMKVDNSHLTGESDLIEINVVMMVLKIQRMLRILFSFLQFVHSEKVVVWLLELALRHLWGVLQIWYILRMGKHHSYIRRLYNLLKL